MSRLVLSFLVVTVFASTCHALPDLQGVQGVLAVAQSLTSVAGQLTPLATNAAGLPLSQIPKDCVEKLTGNLGIILGGANGLTPELLGTATAALGTILNIAQPVTGAVGGSVGSVGSVASGGSSGSGGSGGLLGLGGLLGGLG